MCCKLSRWKSLGCMVKLVASLQIALAVFGLTTSILLLLGVSVQFGAYPVPVDGHHDDPNVPQHSRTAFGYMMTFIVSVTISMCMIHLIFGIILWSIVINRDYRRCKIWLIVATTLIVIRGLSFTYCVAISSLDGIDKQQTITSICGVLLQCVFVWIVYSFWQQLLLEKSIQGQINNGYVVTTLSSSDNLRLNISENPRQNLF